MSKPPPVRPSDRAQETQLLGRLREFEEEYGPLPGLVGSNRRETFVAQLIESGRRVKYIHRLREAELQPSALVPSSGSFDPLKGAILMHRSGDLEEAFWLVFLSVHFGKDPRVGWNLAAGFYGRLGQGGAWGWPDVLADVSTVRDWLDANSSALKGCGRFGNHRKYESLRGWTATGTGEAVATYVAWTGGSQVERCAEVTEGLGTPQARYAALYSSLKPVTRFGRTARFDYLTMLGKVGLLDVVPDSAYLSGATGPADGARLLFAGRLKGGDLRPRDLAERLAPLHEQLDVTFDVLEDAICNWQKSPSRFVPFRG